MLILLIIEDERNIRQFVSANLKARGYNVLQAASAEEGLQQLQKNSPAALVLDIKLPGISGWELLDILAEDQALPNPPVIILTASPLSDLPTEQNYGNIVTMLAKPISAGDLMQAVNKIFG